MHDFVIVGAGVAGCRMARHLEEMGKDYILVEASRRPGIKDSGIVSSRILELYDSVPVKAYEEGMAVKGRYAEAFIRIPGGIYILKRERFARQLRKGLDIAYDTIRHVKAGRFFELVGNETYKAKHLIAADGTGSIVRNSLGIKPPEFLPGMFTFSSRKPGIEVFFDKSISKHFFGWRSLDEYGVADKTLEGFDKLLEKENAMRGKAYTGLIPIRPIWPSYRNLTLLGDSAGMTKPVTGGGIIYSTMAADLLARLVRDGRVHEFGRRWFGMVWREQMIGYAFRKIYPLLPQALIDRIVSMLETDREFDYDFLTTFALLALKKSFKRLWGS